MTMRNPVHPGEIIREECLKPLGLSITEGAKALGISRKVLSEIVNGRAGVSALMAFRLAKAFGSTPEVWGGIQLDYDLAQARKQAKTLKVARVEAPLS